MTITANKFTYGKRNRIFADRAVVDLAFVRSGLGHNISTGPETIKNTGTIPSDLFADDGADLRMNGIRRVEEPQKKSRRSDKPKKTNMDKSSSRSSSTSSHTLKVDDVGSDGIKEILDCFVQPNHCSDTFARFTPNKSSYLELYDESGARYHKDVKYKSTESVLESCESVELFGVPLNEKATSHEFKKPTLSTNDTQPANKSFNFEKIESETSPEVFGEPLIKSSTSDEPFFLNNTLPIRKNINVENTGVIDCFELYESYNISTKSVKVNAGRRDRMKTSKQLVSFCEPEKYAISSQRTITTDVTVTESFEAVKFSSGFHKTTVRTYGNQIYETDMTLSLGVNGGTQHDLEDTHAEYGDAGIDEGLEDSDEESKIKSFHELRDAGHKKQFQDELNYLLGGLESNELNVRRSTALEICGKIQDDTFIKRMRPFSAVSRIFNLICDDGDPLLNAILAFILSLVVGDLKSCNQLDQAKICEWIVKGLEISISNDFLRKTLKAKADKRMTASLKELIIQTQIYTLAEVSVFALLISITSRIIEFKETSIFQAVAIANSEVTCNIFDYFLHTTNNRLSISDVLAPLEVMTINPIQYSEIHKVITSLWSLINESTQGERTSSILNILINIYHHPTPPELISGASIGRLVKCLSSRLDSPDSFEKSQLAVALIVNILQSVPTAIDLILDFVEEKKNGAQIIAAIYLEKACLSVDTPENQISLTYLAILLACCSKSSIAKDYIIATIKSFDTCIILLQAYQEFQQTVSVIADKGVILNLIDILNK